MWSPLVFLLIAACSSPSPRSGSDVSQTPSPFVSCAALAGSGATSVPDVSLPCFTGGEQVPVRQINGPLVINLWASWCGPCRTELPLMQQLADAGAGKLRVIGVDTGDERDAGASFAADKKIDMPTLFDGDSKLQKAIASTTLPVTIFVDASGGTHVYRGIPFTAKTLADQVQAQAGVRVKL
ncbi:TlpA family protein disulfide reductase [Actinoplanes sp. TBRC 11911]|nr:TlpA family protein disulfide reductase [Actinoplanes sp. TBRC 11911]